MITFFSSCELSRNCCLDIQTQPKFLEPFSSMEFLLADESDIDRKSLFFFSEKCCLTCASPRSHANLHMVTHTTHLWDPALYSAIEKSSLVWIVAMKGLYLLRNPYSRSLLVEMDLLNAVRWVWDYFFFNLHRDWKQLLRRSKYWPSSSIMKVRIFYIF